MCRNTNINFELQSMDFLYTPHYKTFLQRLDSLFFFPKKNWKKKMNLIYYLLNSFEIKDVCFAQILSSSFSLSALHLVITTK